MHAKNLFIDNCGHWKTVKAISESFPKFDVISSLAFIIEAIDSVDAGAFMVSSKKEEVFRVFDFISEKQADSF